MMKMKNILLAVMLACCSLVLAQQDDPILMTINGKNIHRSEFEYSYNKNNAEGVIDKKSVGEYVDLFINYQLKVIAAEEARLDTLSSFKKEFAMYRDAQIKPTMITDADVEQKAHEIYQQTANRVNASGGLVKVSHILIVLKQTAGEADRRIAEQRADSVYRALCKGANFGELAKRISDDRASASRGGELPWLERGQTLEEFDKAIFSMKKGELSKPIQTPAGYHIILLKDKRSFFPYDSLKTEILQFIEQRGIRDQLISKKIQTAIEHAGSGVTEDDILAQKRKELVAKNPQLKYLIKEYHDGLLLFEVMTREIFSKAQNNAQALNEYFRQNRKKYKWEQPRFKGIAYYTKNKKDIKAVRKAVRHVPFEEWTKVIQQTFNQDSTIRVSVDKNIFKSGDHPLVDCQVFKKKGQVKPLTDFPYAATYGKKLKKPQSYQDVEAQVVADYQEELEKQWVQRLRRKYPISVRRDILATVNQHP